MIKRASASVLLAGLVVLSSGFPAGGHAVVESSSRSSPAAGAILSNPPLRVSIVFTEPPDPSLSLIRVLDSTGAQIQSGPAALGPGNSSEMAVPLPASLPAGTYTAVFRAVSKTDGHVASGSFAFSVRAPGSTRGAGAGAPSGESTSRVPRPSGLSVAGRWLFYIGLALLLGAAVYRLFVVPGNVRPGALWLGLAGAVAGWALSIVALRSSVGVSFGTLLGAATAVPALRQLAGLVLCAAAIAVLLWRKNRFSLWLLAGVVLFTMLLHSLASHAEASSHLPWLNVAVQSLHLASSGVWFGGLVFLVAGIVAGEVHAAQAKRFSVVATAAIVTVALTGAARLLDELGGLGSLGRLFDTGFGKTALVKIILFGCVAAIGAFNHWFTVPGMKNGKKGSGALAKTIVAEIAILAGIFGVTGVLSQLPPPAGTTAVQGRSAPMASDGGRGPVISESDRDSPVAEWE